MNGLYIGFEGGEACGKSTQAKILAEWLTRQGYSVVQTREPGGTPTSEEIRKVILQKRDFGQLTTKAQLLLMEAARTQIIDGLVKPALNEGKIVITDRYALTSQAYQGIAGGLGLETVNKLNDFATNGLYPEVTFIINIDPKAGLAREVESTRYSAEPMEFHQKANKAYLELATKNPKLVIINYIDGKTHSKGVEGAIADMQKQIREKLAQYLQQALKKGDITLN